MKIIPKLRLIEYGGKTKLEIEGDIDLQDDAIFTPATGTANLFTLKTLVTDHTTDGGALTETITGSVPAGAIVLGVSAIITTVVGMTTGVSWSLGDGTDADLYGAGLALAAGTHVDGEDYTAPPGAHIPGADLVMTANAGTIDSGVVRFTVFYIDVGTPTA